MPSVIFLIFVTQVSEAISMAKNEDFYTIKARIYHSRYLNVVEKSVEGFGVDFKDSEGGTKFRNRDVPDYMLKLYENYSSGKKRMKSDKVRSFSSLEIDYQDLGPLHSVHSRHHVDGEWATCSQTLAFNATSALHSSELINEAHLRLSSSLQECIQHPMSRITISCLKFSEELGSTYETVSTKLVNESRRPCRTYDVTKALQIWQNHKESTNILNIRIERLLPTIIRSGPEVQRNRRINHNKSLLIVYSSKRSSKDKMETKKVHKRFANYEETEAKYNEIVNRFTSLKHFYGTSRRRNRPREHCRRVPMFVDFTTINYDSWIIAPKGYQAYSCTGMCYFPLAAHLSPTKHAIIQSLLQAVSPKTSYRVCCVPTKLKPMSLLYFDHNGVLTYQYQYHGMVVAQCGCR